MNTHERVFTTRQPGRPSEEDVIFAAKCVVSSELHPRNFGSKLDFFESMHVAKHGQRRIFEILNTERAALEDTHTQESLEDFALRILAWYQKQGKIDNPKKHVL